MFSYTINARVLVVSCGVLVDNSLFLAGILVLLLDLFLLAPFKYFKFSVFNCKTLTDSSRLIVSYSRFILVSCSNLQILERMEIVAVLI